MNNITIKKLKSITELQELMRVFSLAFESPYTTTDEYLSSMLQNSSCIILGAVVEAHIVGGLVAFEMTPMHGTKEFYIYDIAVHPDYQKNGIGSTLINKIRSEASMCGAETIFVEAESEDEDAIKFYRSLKGEEVRVNHFNFKSNQYTITL